MVHEGIGTVGFMQKVCVGGLVWVYDSPREPILGEYQQVLDC